MHRLALSAIAVMTLVTGSVARASTWEIDPAHTSAQFAVKHLMVSTVRGTLGKVTGTATIDAADITKSSVQASIDATAIDTREPKRDAHLKSPDFFDSAKYPTITFKSKQVRKTGEDRFQVLGDLTMHGITREVALDVQGTPKEFRDPMGNMKLGGVATTRINRQDFGVNWSKPLDGGGVVVGDDVDVTIDVEMVQKAAPAAN
jgi:polyisoprenoid-binding protein YceI